MTVAESERHAFQELWYGRERALLLKLMQDNQLPGSPRERSGRARDKKNVDVAKPAGTEQIVPETGPAVSNTEAEDRSDEEPRARDKEGDGKTVANP